MRKQVLVVALLVALAVTAFILQPGSSASNRRIAETATPLSVDLPLVVHTAPTVLQPSETVEATSTVEATLEPTTKATSEPNEPTATMPTATETSPESPSITRLAVGIEGYSDVGTHQVVRTSGDRAYLFVPQIYQPLIRAMRATTAGTPEGFAEADKAHHPTANMPIWAVDAAIDAKDVVHVFAIAEDGPLYYQTFDTKTDSWGTRQQVASSAWPNRNSGLRQGSAGVSIALDQSGVAHVVYSKTQSNRRRVYYNNDQGGNWNHETLVDDQPNADNSHALLAFGTDGALHMAWLADDGTHGALRLRTLRAGSWGTASLIDGDVFRDNQYSIDQGPSLIVTRDNVVHVAYIGPYEAVQGSPSGFDYGRAHHKYRAGNAAATAEWTSDDPPALYTHNPSLATDDHGNLFMFGHRAYWQADHCAAMLANVKPAGGTWTSWRILAAGCYDSSVSVKWAQYHMYAAGVIEGLYWTEHGPNGEADQNNLYYAAVRGGSAAIDSLPVATP